VISIELPIENDYLDMLDLLTSPDISPVETTDDYGSSTPDPASSSDSPANVLSSSCSGSEEDNGAGQSKKVVPQSEVGVTSKQQKKRKVSEALSIPTKEKEDDGSDSIPEKKQKKEQCKARRTYAKWPPFCMTQGRDWKLNSIVILYEMEKMNEKQTAGFKTVIAHDAIPIYDLPGFYFVNLEHYFPPAASPEQIWNNTRYKRFARKGLGSLSSFNKREVVEKYWQEYKKSRGM